MFRNLSLLTASLALCAGAASAQTYRLNEVFVSHVSTDDREFMEVRGPAGASLNGFMLLVVEGEGTATGTLDVVIDLSAGALDANGLYTVGSMNIVPPVNQVYGAGTNLFENGPETVYLIHTTNVPGVTALLATDVRVGGAGLQTVLANDPAIQIWDLVGLDNPNTPGTIYDSAVTIVDGSFFPAGVARCTDAPFAWNVLDFDFLPSPPYFDVSPGAPNASCGSVAFTEFCFGDGAGLACPCGNNSTVGANEGCLNSLGLGGRIVATGNPSIASDSLLLTGSQMPNSSALYFQGTSQQGGGNGVLFGDGLRCAGGAIIRLATKNNMLGTSSYPAVGDLPVSVRGLVGMPGTRTYQCWYRNAANFCTVSTFNLTNGVEVPWGA